jgi:murein L,D-transpeptidase YafK
MLLLPLALMTGGCGERSEAKPAPGEPRAAAAAARVRPELDKALAARKLVFGDPVFIRAFKKELELEVFVRDRASGKFVHFRTYRIARASGELGPKLREGDRQVPEGFYATGRRGMKPDSTYHLAFNIGYPNAYDRHHGRTGSLIMVHGNRISIGCLAMTDAKIEEIYTLCDAALRNGQPFFRTHIFPFRMTAANLEARKDSPWADFWRNLKEGYDFFETHHIPPDATLSGGRYVFQNPI